MGGAFPGLKKHNTATKQDQLGQVYEVRHSLGGCYYWMYVKASAAVTAGNMVQIEVAEETVANITGFGNTGDRAQGIYPYVEDSGETWTVNEHKGAYLYVGTGTGLGQMKRIRSNTATRAYFEAIHPNMGEADVFATAVDTTSDIVILNPWHVKPTTASTIQQTVWGQAPFALTSLYYGYILVPRPPIVTFVKSSGTLTVGGYVGVNDNTAGQVAIAGTGSDLGDETVCGIALHAGIEDNYGPILLGI